MIPICVNKAEREHKTVTRIPLNYWLFAVSEHEIKTNDVLSQRKTNNMSFVSHFVTRSMYLNTYIVQTLGRNLRSSVHRDSDL